MKEVKREMAGICRVFLVVVVVLSGAVRGWSAGVPRKQPVGRYAKLWTDSPFTVKPVVEEEEVSEEDRRKAFLSEMAGIAGDAADEIEDGEKET